MKQATNEMSTGIEEILSPSVAINFTQLETWRQRWTVAARIGYCEPPQPRFSATQYPKLRSNTKRYDRAGQVQITRRQLRQSCRKQCRMPCWLFPAENEKRPHSINCSGISEIQRRMHHAEICRAPIRLSSAWAICERAANVPVAVESRTGTPRRVLSPLVRV